MAHFREYHRCYLEGAGRHLPCAPDLDVAAAAEVDGESQRLDDPIQTQVSHEQPYPWAAASKEEVPCSYS